MSMCAWVLRSPAVPPVMNLVHLGNAPDDAATIVMRIRNGRDLEFSSTAGSLIGAETFAPDSGWTFVCGEVGVDGDLALVRIHGNGLLDLNGLPVSPAHGWRSALA